MIERLLAAESALSRDELDLAERQFASVTAADPRNAIALVGLARVAARRGDTQAARGFAMGALDIDPDEAAAARLLGELDGVRSAAATNVPAPAPAAPPPRPVPWWRRWLDRLRGRG